jgi:excisionase family DNA binding protein
MGKMTFDAMPEAMDKLLLKIENIERLLVKKGTERTHESRIFDIGEAAEFCRLSKPTLYALVSKSEIPHSKKGKRLYFSEDELKGWIQEGRRKTQTELAADAQKYIANKSKKRG